MRPDRAYDTMFPAMNDAGFKVKQYRFRSGKLHLPLRALHLTDLHCRLYGEENRELLDQCRALKPDLILCTGDMVTGKRRINAEEVIPFLGALCELAPIYYANGNHETFLRRSPDIYRRYVLGLRSSGIFLINNKTEDFFHGEDRIRISGLELPPRLYAKMRIPSMSDEELYDLIGPPCGGEEEYRILLAHNPQFAEQYVDWGADLTLCGHFHGGVMRLWKNQVAMSPYGFPLPKYGYGAYHKDGRAVVVSGGLGDHAVSLRFRNPPELVVLNLLPDKNE